MFLQLHEDMDNLVELSIFRRWFSLPQPRPKRKTFGTAYKNSENDAAANSDKLCGDHDKVCKIPCHIAESSRRKHVQKGLRLSPLDKLTSVTKYDETLIAIAMAPADDCFPIQDQTHPVA